jgi:hypothetical protein
VDEGQEGGLTCVVCVVVLYREVGTLAQSSNRNVILSLPGFSTLVLRRKRAALITPGVFARDTGAGTLHVRASRRARERAKKW